MNSKRSMIFLGFTFSLTWGAWWVLAYLTQQGITSLGEPLGFILLVLGGSAPTIVAYVAILLTKENGNIGEFHSRVFKVKNSYKYYLYAIFLPIFIGLFSLGFAFIFSREPLVGHSINPLYTFIPLFLVSIIMGGVEEFGWRGILQPELVKKHNYVTSNLIIGVIWALWHLPFFYIVGTSHYGSSFLVFIFSCIGFSSFLTWIYGKTESVFLCVLFHASINASGGAGLIISFEATTIYTLMSITTILVGYILLFNLDKGSNPNVIKKEIS